MQLYGIAAVGFLSAVPLLTAHADWEYTKWGMTPEQVVQASNGSLKILPKNEQKENDTIKMTTKVGGVMTDGALKYDIQFSFATDTNKLAMVGYAVADQAQNNLLLAWLTKKYGAPQHKSAIEAIKYYTYAWDTPDDIMMAFTQGTSAFVMQSQRNQR